MSESLCRWGILGTASIARKNWKAIKNAENAVLAGVASRTLERAETYIRENQADAPFCEAPRAIGSYEEMITDPGLDALYIPLPTGIRKEWAIKAANAGKHVLAEKPAGDTVAEVEEIVAACKANNIQYMDGVMFMHSARLSSLNAKLHDEKAIGQLKRITSQFSFAAPEDFIAGNIRVHSDLESLGCLGDLGWYCVRMTLCLLNGEMPRRITGRLINELGQEGSPEKVPVEFSAELEFGNDVSAGFYCSFLTGHQQWANVSGTEGYIHVRDFVLPHLAAEVSYDVVKSDFDIVGCDFNMQDHTTRVGIHEYSNSAANAQETNLIRNFSEIVNTGNIDSYWPEISLKTQRVINACLESARRGESIECS